ncbi:MAG: metal ABC transporter permease [bacterium]|nr:metal ABC transporter permease [bacterium]MDZ4286252.1 metal ABC transporter permease [Candidatus Sungbacteria bacterium]
MIDLFSFETIVVALVVGIASGAIGAFIILKRMALVGDALSHVALPGIALALAYNIDPFWGVLVCCIAAAIIVWSLERKTRLYSDALVGILFTFSLAIGILAIPDEEVLHSLFGAFQPLSLPVFFFISGVGMLLIAATFVMAKRFLFSIISPDLAYIESPKWSRLYDLILFIIFSCVVALGIKLVGTLLMGALTIIPASIAKNISRSMGGYIVLSALFGGAISLLGVIIASQMEFLPGPSIILLGIGVFVVSLFFTKKV